jgi:very-short-patch-repair endonuclease
MKKERYPQNSLYERAREFRSNPTRAERLLWQALRNRKLSGFKFRRQYRLGPFIVDFYCFESRLVLELDGRVHQNQADYDRERSRYLQERGLYAFRIANNEVESDVDKALESILKICIERKSPML